MGRMRKMKDEREDEGKELKIGVEGWVEKEEGKEILRSEKNVDIVIGKKKYKRMKNEMERVSGGEKVVEKD